MKQRRRLSQRGGDDVRQQEIIAAIRAGEEQGAEELLRHYGPLLRYVIAPIL